MASIPSNSKKQQKKNTGIYMLNILTRKVSLRFNTVGSNIQEHISNKLIMNLEGKCSKEGYIKRNSVRVLSYSAGVVQSNNIVFDVSFECLICNPCEGQKIKVIVENITKAGIKANYYKLDETQNIDMNSTNIFDELKNKDWVEYE